MGEVVDLNVVTRLNLDPDRVLNAAAGELQQVIIMGYTKDGDEYFASSISDGPDCLWLIERLKMQLLATIDKHST